MSTGDDVRPVGFCWKDRQGQLEPNSFVGRLPTDDDHRTAEYHAWSIELIYAAADYDKLREERDAMFLRAREWAFKFGEQEARAVTAEAELFAATARVKAAEAKLRAVDEVLIDFDNRDYNEPVTCQHVVDQFSAALNEGGDRADV